MSYHHIAAISALKRLSRNFGYAATVIQPNLPPEQRESFLSGLQTISSRFQNDDLILKNDITVEELLSTYNTLRLSAETLTDPVAKKTCVDLANDFESVFRENGYKLQIPSPYEDFDPNIHAALKTTPVEMQNVSGKIAYTRFAGIDTDDGQTLVAAQVEIFEFSNS